jgi:hypothetical protein
MRHILRGLPIAALLVLAAAGCSDSDAGGPDQAAGDTDAPEESEPTEATAEAFCADIEALNEQFADDTSGDVTAVIDAMDSLDAPEEIADDLQAMIDGARAQSEVDAEDAEAVAELQEELAAAGEAQERVNAFVEENCDFASAQAESPSD